MKAEFHNGDVVERLRALPEGLVDMTLTSPPYDDLRHYDGHLGPINYDIVANELIRVTKDGGVVIWVVGDRTIEGSESLTSFRQALAFQETGWRVHDTMIYAKNNPIPGNVGRRYRQTFEYMFAFSKGTPKTFNPITEPTKDAGKVYQSFRVTADGRGNTPDEGMRMVKAERNASNIFYYNVGTASSKDKIAFEHPAIFPEKLAEDQIRTWTNEGDVVLDCFSGSGTTAKAAVSLERRFIGIDINARYNAIALERLAKLRGLVNV